MKLHELKPAEGSTAPAWRKGRGPGSVLIGVLLFLAAIAHTKDESSPPESKKPTFASATGAFPRRPPVFCGYVHT